MKRFLDWCGREGGYITTEAVRISWTNGWNVIVVLLVIFVAWRVLR